MEERYNIKDEWPDGISDGLSLPCSDCGEFTNFDYTVTDEFWNQMVPDDKKRGVVCLDCLDKRAKKSGALLCQHLLRVQYTGFGETIVLKPEFGFVYKSAG